MTQHAADDTFRSSILYWAGILDQVTNQHFIRETGGGKSDISQWRVLSVLSDENGLTITELSRRAMIERTALSHLLSVMEQRALVSRTPRPKDRRTIEVHMLPNGQHRYAEMLPVRREVFRRATAGLHDTELDLVLVTLRRMIENLEGAGTRQPAPMTPGCG